MILNVVLPRRDPIRRRRSGFDLALVQEGRRRVGLLLLAVDERDDRVTRAWSRQRLDNDGRFETSVVLVAVELFRFGRWRRRRETVDELEDACDCRSRHGQTRTISDPDKV